MPERGYGPSSAASPQVEDQPSMALEGEYRHLLAFSAAGTRQTLLQRLAYLGHPQLPAAAQVRGPHAQSHATEVL